MGMADWVLEKLDCYYGWGISIEDGHSRRWISHLKHIGLKREGRVNNKNVGWRKYAVFKTLYGWNQNERVLPLQ